MSYTNIPKVGNLQAEARRGLTYYKEEINILERRLEEMAATNSSYEARQQIEHFQNQFILQRNSVDELKHKVNLYVDHLTADIQQHTGHKEMRRVEERDALKDEYLELEKIIKELRREFTVFQRDWT